MSASGQYQVVLEETVFIKVENGLMPMEDDPLTVRPADLTELTAKVKTEFIPEDGGDETNGTGKNNFFEFPEGLKTEIKVEEVDIGAEDAALAGEFVSEDSNSSDDTETNVKEEVAENEDESLHVSDDSSDVSEINLKEEVVEDEDKRLHVSNDRFFKALFASKVDNDGKLSPITLISEKAHSSDLSASPTANVKPSNHGSESNADSVQLPTLTKRITLHSDEKPFACVFCAARFPKNSQLKSHYLTLHCDEKPCFCPICPATFKTSQELTLHAAVHSNERPHTCAVCNSMFRTKAHLKKHSVIHLNNQLSCKLCPETFRYHYQLKHHSAKHAGGKIYPCLFCTARFFKPKELKAHSVVFHSDERPFYCMLCSATFKTAAELRSHSTSHSGKKQCPRTYGQCRYV